MPTVRFGLELPFERLRPLERRYASALRARWAKENFPALPVRPHTLVQIPAAALESLIAKTKFAISMEESRYTLNGSLLILKPDTLAFEVGSPFVSGPQEGVKKWLGLP